MSEAGRQDGARLLGTGHIADDHHAALTRLILDAGCDVFFEKPLGLEVDECESLCEAASRTGRSLGVGHEFLSTRARTALGWQPIDDAEILIREGIEAPVDACFR